MGNTQVTPIKPAIPPLISLAGKLGAETRERSNQWKIRKPCVSSTSDLTLFVCQPFMRRPSRSVSASSSAIVLSLREVFAASLGSGGLQGDLQNENATFLQLKREPESLSQLEPRATGGFIINQEKTVTKQAVCVDAPARGHCHNFIQSSKFDQINTYRLKD